MSWGKLLQPDLVLGGSVFDLTPELIQRHELKGVVLDVDETLVPFRLSEVSDELHQWMEQIRPLVSLWLVSNNLSYSRISSIGSALSVPYILGARKPSRRKLRQAVEAMNLPFSQVAMVGDRLFTDVLAGNRLGMFTILVEPMVPADSEARKHHVRNFEVWFSQAMGASLLPHNSPSN